MGRKKARHKRGVGVRYYRRPGKQYICEAETVVVVDVCAFVRGVVVLVGMRTEDYETVSCGEIVYLQCKVTTLTT